MKQKSFCVVTTTIRVPTLLREYAKDARHFERTIEQFIVVGDKKTPPEAETFCNELESEFGIPCRYLGVPEQESFLEQWPLFRDFLPWNCIQRRNVGMLFVYFEGLADIVVTLDDDNLLSEPDYFGFHSHIGAVQNLPVVASESGWWNPCEMLLEERGIPFYHRGYPLSMRFHEKENNQHWNERQGRTVVNAGLWLEEPDVDALTRLYFPVRAISQSSRFRQKVALAPGTWCPFNSQNTALFRELISAYFLFPYIGRYDDIWASYIIRHISDALGDYVTYGSPIVRQKRNPHNFFQDFDAERFGFEYNEIFLEALRMCVISSKTYQGAFGEIAAQFPQKIAKTCEIHQKDAKLFEKVCDGLKIWTEVFRS